MSHKLSFLRKNILRRLLVCLPGCLGCLATKDAQGYSEGSFQLVSCWRAVRKFLVFCLINHQITTIAHSLRFCEEKPKDKRKRTWRETMPFANLLRSKASVVLAIPPALYEFSMPPFCRPPLCPFIFSSCLTKNLFSILLNSRSPSERSGKGCCGQWFAGPPLRALIAVVALGGVACALGGAALGATGLAGPPNSHLTAALLMIGE